MTEKDRKRQKKTEKDRKDRKRQKKTEKDRKRQKVKMIKQFQISQN